MCMETMQKIKKILIENNISLTDYTRYAFDENKNEFLRLNEKSYSDYCTLYNDICDMHQISTQYSSNEKGANLEKLSKLLLLSGENPLFSTMRNKKTSTNEIDILVQWTDIACFAGINNIYNFLGESFLCECKNYDGKIGVTYIGKFYSLLKVSHAKLGILFSWDGVTGSSKWKDGKGLIKKIALKDEIFIIDFNSDDFKLVCDTKVDFLSIIKEKYIELKNDICYDQHISPHESEDAFKLS